MDVENFHCAKMKVRDKGNAKIKGTELISSLFSRFAKISNHIGQHLWQKYNNSKSQFFYTVTKSSSNLFQRFSVTSTKLSYVFPINNDITISFYLFSLINSDA